MKDRMFYGLRFKPTGEALGFSWSSNDGADCCVSVAFSLDRDEDNVWLVSDRETAERVSRESERWYNAGFGSPMHTFSAEDLEVFEVTIPTQEGR